MFTEMSQIRAWLESLPSEELLGAFQVAYWAWWTDEEDQKEHTDKAEFVQRVLDSDPIAVEGGLLDFLASYRKE